MPELPEVETTLKGIQPYLQGNSIQSITVRHRGLRWPVPCHLNSLLKGKKISAVHRRAKYLLLTTSNGTLIIHLGMSGSLRILHHALPPQKHDHCDLTLNNGVILRYTDPRRFGALLWTDASPTEHPLLRSLGPEPLENAFSGAFLLQKAAHKKTPIKSLIMDGHIVVGVGNIYAAEALFEAEIHPALPAGQLNKTQCSRLAAAIKKTLRRAIRAGGTTLRDFSGSDGRPGYFRQKLQVYGRAGEPCNRCGTPLESIRIGQRSTVFCPACQR